MPHRFTSRAVRSGRTFQCDLESRVCDAHSVSTNEPCRRRCVIGLTKCWSHTRSELHLRIDDSPHGKGVFAHNPRAAAQDVPVFRGNARRGDVIVPYMGEVITEAQRETRYATSTAPYLMSPTANRHIDAACVRGIGSMINHAPASTANCTYTSAGNVRACKPIMHGEELRANYGATGARGYRKGDHLTPPRRVR